jgi:hypothetical protein
MSIFLCGCHNLANTALFVWLISHQPAVLFYQNKSTISNQPTILFSQNKPAPAISHQPTEQAVHFTHGIPDLGVVAKNLGD